MIQKVVFPSFRENEYSQYDMRQLVSALELRFQSLESNVEGFFPTSADADFDDRYAAAVHTHLVADIIDFDANVPSSIFDLDDVTGTASVGQGLIWNGAEFVAGPLGGSTSLNDLLDVNAASPSNGEALVWDVSTLRWVPGTVSGGGGDSLFGLTDTDLAGQLQGDLLFNANGTEWQATGWKFQWVDDQYLQLGNGIGVNWYDSNFNTAEFLVLEGANGPGPVLTDESLTQVLGAVTTDSATYVDVTGFTIDTSGLTDGANYWIWVHSAYANWSGNFSTTCQTRLAYGGTGFPGSVGVFSTAAIGPGHDFSYQTLHPINVAENITLQARNVNQDDDVENNDFAAFGLNADSLGSDFFFSEDPTTTVTGVSWNNTAASVTVPAGDYLIGVTANHNSYGFTDTMYTGIDDGTSVTEVCEFRNDAPQDKHVSGGLWIKKSVAADTVFTTSVRADGTFQVTHAAISAIRLEGFAEQYSDVYLANITAPDRTAPGPNPLTRSFTAQNSGEFIAVGFCRQTWGGSGFSGSQEITVNINSGGATQVARSYNHDHDHSSDFYTLDILPFTTFTLTAGDSVEVKFEQRAAPPAALSEQWEGLGMAVFSLATSDIFTEAFTVGDPAYKTQIDGTAICVANNVGINWEDSNSVEAEFLVLEGAVGISSEWGSSMNSDWTAFGVVAGTVALESTGILQDSSFGMDGFDVSDDGLVAIWCDAVADKIAAYNLDSPFDFENATLTGAIFIGAGAFNPGDGIQWINSGASYMVHLSSAGTIDIYNCPSPYVVNGLVAVAQSVNSSDLGFETGNYSASYYMSRDGTKLVASGHQTLSTEYSVKIFALATPFVITTGRTLLSTYTYTGDTNAPNGKMRGMSLSEDGLTLIFNYSSAQINIGNMTVPFDVTTMTFPGARNVQADFTGVQTSNSWLGNHVTPDGNSIYVFDNGVDALTKGRIARYDKTVPNPAVQDETFIVGDPGYSTVIEGTATNITSVATDIDGTLNVDGLATFQADVTISDDLTITSGAPKIFMQDSDATADEGNWIIANTTDQFRIETASDAAPETPIDQAITIGRTGTAVDSVDVVATDVTITSTTIDINGVDPTTHLGEVTGGQSLTLDVTAITNRDDVVADATDDVAIHDETDGSLKKVNLSSITDGGNF